MFREELASSGAVKQIDFEGLKKSISNAIVSTFSNMAEQLYDDLKDKIKIDSQKEKEFSLNVSYREFKTILIREHPTTELAMLMGVRILDSRNIKKDINLRERKIELV